MTVLPASSNFRISSVSLMAIDSRAPSQHDFKQYVPICVGKRASCWLCCALRGTAPQGSNS